MFDDIGAFYTVIYFKKFQHNNDFINNLINQGAYPIGTTWTADCTNSVSGEVTQEIIMPCVRFYEPVKTLA